MAELNTKNSTKGHLRRRLRRRLVEFLVLNSIYQLISVSSDAENSVWRRLVSFCIERFGEQFSIAKRVFGGGGGWDETT